MADGGWARRVWAVWQASCARDPMNGAWTVDGDFFRLAVPAAVLADDDERLEWLQAMRLCANVMQDKNALLDNLNDDGEADG